MNKFNNSSVNKDALNSIIDELKTASVPDVTAEILEHHSKLQTMFSEAEETNRIAGEKALIAMQEVKERYNILRFYALFTKVPYTARELRIVLTAYLNPLMSNDQLKNEITRINQKVDARLKRKKP